MTSRTFIHPSLKEQTDLLSSRTRDIIEQSLQILKQNQPDTFLGRQTFTPFPKEEEPYSVQ